MEPSVIKHIPNDACNWEGEVLPLLSKEGKLAAYLHYGFWQAMDTMRDKVLLDDLWATGAAPWKDWEG